VVTGAGVVSTVVVFDAAVEVEAGGGAELDDETGEGLKLSKAELPAAVAGGALSLAAGTAGPVAAVVDLRPRL
jgi:hypothetical protein